MLDSFCLSANRIALLQLTLNACFSLAKYRYILFREKLQLPQKCSPMGFQGGFLPHSLFFPPFIIRDNLFLFWYLLLQITLGLSQLLCGIESCILNLISAATHVWSRRQPGWSRLFRLVLSFAGLHEGQNIIPPLKLTDCGQLRRGWLTVVRLWLLQPTAY